MPGKSSFFNDYSRPVTPLCGGPGPRPVSLLDQVHLLPTPRSDRVDEAGLAFFSLVTETPPLSMAMRPVCGDFCGAWGVSE